VGATQISELQRVRILSAAAEIVDERGYTGMNVTRVTARAGVSRRTFYDLFDDREDCFIALFDETVARATEVAQSAAAGQQSWCEQARAGLSALLRLAEEEPVRATLVIVHALGGGPNVLTRRARCLDTLIAFVDQGRRSGRRGLRTRAAGKGPPADARWSALTAEGVVGAVLAVVYARMLEPDDRPLIVLLNPLMDMIVLPYLGPVAAAKELSRPMPAVEATPRRPAKDPLKGLHIRPTYRTLRVLAAIAELGGRESSYPSNREVADHAGVHDQGQISKLLARLGHFGLIENACRGHAKGEANAWRLTPEGEQLERSVRVESGR
jgi:AcrR family transcriptional regulator